MINLLKHPVLIFLSVTACFFSCQTGNDNVTFIVSADMHLTGVDSLDKSIRVFIDEVNSLKDRSLPDTLGVTNIEPRGVIVAGDITQDGLPHEWGSFKQMFGLNGDALMNYPVYEGTGNHDGNIDGAVRQGIRDRNISRPDVVSISHNKLHYAWKWGEIHLLQLNSYPSSDWDPDCEWCHYFHESFRDPEKSLDFLQDYLSNGITSNEEPVILFFHYGWDGFSDLWWTENEKQAFYETIKDHNIIGIFTGHCHAIEHYKWKGIDIWSSGSPNKPEGEEEFLWVQVKDDKMVVLGSKGEEWIKAWEIKTNR